MTESNTRIKKSSDLKKIEKPWGYEIWWAKTSNYAGKFIHINKNSRMSLQYHKNKEETIYVMNGILLVWEDPQGNDDPISLNPGSIYHVEPGQVHRFGAGGVPAMICEVSTSELDDVIRLADDYKR